MDSLLLLLHTDPCRLKVFSEYLSGLLAGVLRREEDGYLLSKDSLVSGTKDSLEELSSDSCDSLKEAAKFLLDLYSLWFLGKE